MDKIKQKLLQNPKLSLCCVAGIVLISLLSFLGGIYAGRTDFSTQKQIDSLTRLSAEQSSTLEALRKELRESKERLERATSISDKLEDGAKRGASSAAEAGEISADGLRNNQEAERILREIIQESKKSGEPKKALRN